MPDTTVKYFDSTMSGAPTLNGNAGTAIAVLDACLVTGFGSVTLNSLVVAANVATGTVSGGHNFAMIGTTVGPVITIEGATPSGLNGEWRLASVPNSTTFTFATTGISDQTATGTITAKRAPAGFAKAFSGTNKAAYRSLDPDSTQLYLRVLDDDSTNNNAIISGYVTMSDVDTGTEPFPAAANYLYKINDTSTSAPWWLFADARAFWLFSRTNENGIIGGAMYFGDLAEIARLDARYACGIIGGLQNNSYLADTTKSSSVGAGLARSYTSAEGATSFFRVVHPKFDTLANPCPVNNGVFFVPIEAWESYNNHLPAGIVPGCYRSLNLQSGLAHGTFYYGVPQLPGRTLVVQAGGSSSDRWIFDLTGPWR